MTIERSDQVLGSEYDIPQLVHLKGGEKKGIAPGDWDIEVINPNTDEGLLRLKACAERCTDPSRDITDRPYRSGQKEINELAAFFERLPDTEEALTAQALELLRPYTEGLTEDEVRNVVSHGSLVSDLCELKQMLAPYVQDSSLVEQNARWIWDEQDRKLDRYIGPEEVRILQMSRFVGLIPFEAIKKLREMDIRVVGASVAASTIDLLVALGAENITFCDGGTLDPSNGPKSPAGMASYRNNGVPKAVALERLIRERNPYGNFKGIPGLVLLDGQEPSTKHDITLRKLVEGAGLVIEVVDHPLVKVKTRTVMEEIAPTIPLGYVADLGSNPIAGLEIPQEGNWFNQGISAVDKERMANPPEGNHPVLEGLRDVYLMVDASLPDDHRLQFLLARLGIMPYWAQTPGSSRSSGDLMTKAIISYLSGEQITGHNLSQTDAPTTLNARFSAQQSITLRKIGARVFDTK